MSVVFSRLGLSVALSAALLCASTDAWATDGRIQINAARAAAGAINESLVNDPVGYPVVITAPGSYVLTSNLTVPDANTTAIQIDSAGVTIDLNGFEIIGSVDCDPLPCAGSGTGSAINSDQSAITVRNGTVRGMGWHAIDLTGAANRIEDVVAYSNGTSGFFGGFNSLITRVTSTFSGSDGIACNHRCLITDSVLGEYSSDGVDAANGGIVSGSTLFKLSGAANGLSLILGASVVRDNTLSGVGPISTSHASIIEGNSVTSSGTDSIFTADGSVVVDNSVVDGSNGTTAGIGCVVLQNSATNTTSTAYTLGANTGYLHNTSTTATTHFAAGTAKSLDCNAAGASATGCRP